MNASKSSAMLFTIPVGASRNPDQSSSSVIQSIVSMAPIILR
jgi:hypothetical protein